MKMADFDEEIDWYPLPEIASSNNVHVKSTPSLSSVKRPLRQDYSNLSILSLKSSTFASQQTPPSVSSIATTRPSTTPTNNQLDYLWNKFIELYISKPHPFLTNTKQENCMCTCHRTSLTTPTSLKFNVSPPQTPKPHTHTKDKPIIINNSHQKSAEINQKSPKPVMERLSLQDACRHFKKSFIKNSEERQKMLRNRHRLVIKIPVENPASTLIRNALIGTHVPSQTGDSNAHLNICNHGNRYTSRKPTTMDISPPSLPSIRPKMSMKAMYQQSKRYWNTLPEVQAKEREKRRERDAATNRLRVKVYQKEVLARMRRLRRDNQKKHYLVIKQ